MTEKQKIVTDEDLEKMKRADPDCANCERLHDYAKLLERELEHKKEDIKAYRETCELYDENYNRLSDQLKEMREIVRQKQARKWFHLYMWPIATLSAVLLAVSAAWGITDLILTIKGF